MALINRDKSGCHVLGIWESETEEVRMARCDANTLAVKVLNYIWDTETLEAKLMEQPTINLGQADLHVTMGDMEKIGAGTYWLDFRYEYDVDGNCIYQGKHTELSASVDSTAWRIIRYDYDINSNCTQKRIQVTSWTNRAAGW